METIAVAARKGGVGRTMVANNLIWHFTEQPEARVLAIDLDPYGVMKERLHAFEDGGDANDLFRGELAVPLGQRVCLGTDTPVDHLYGEESVERLTQFRRNLARWAPHFDRCVIDTPVDHSKRSLSSLLVSDHVIVPCEPSPWAIASLDLMADEIVAANALREGFGDEGINVLGVVLTRVCRNSLSQRQVTALREKIGDSVFQTELWERAVVGKANDTGVPVWKTKLRSSEYRIVAALDAFFAEVRERMNTVQNRVVGTPGLRQLELA